jgi:hypothetical protein
LPSDRQPSETVGQLSDLQRGNNTNNLIHRIQVKPESSMRQETWMDISALEKTQPINRQNPNNNISTGYYNLQDQATPNPRVKQFGVTDTPNIIQSTTRQMITSDRISITPPGYQN